MTLTRRCNSLLPNRTQRPLPTMDQLLAQSRNDKFLLTSVEDYTYLLGQCGSAKSGEHALGLLALLHNDGLESHALLGNHLVVLLADVSLMNAAQQIFDKLLVQQDRTCHSIIIGYVKSGEPYHALTLFRRLQSNESIHLSGPVAVALFRACAAAKDLVLANEIHAEIARTGLLDKDCFVGSTLIDMYAKWCMLAQARQVFEKLSIRNVVIWNTFMAAYAKYGYGQEVLQCLDQMRHEGITPDPVTFVCSLKACAKIHAIDKGQEIHDEAERQGLLERDHVLACAVIDMYIKDGFLARAQEVFDKLPIRDAVTWTALLGGYAEHGHPTEVLQCLEQMHLECIAFDDAAVVCMLKACGAIRAVDKGRHLHAKFESLGLLQNSLILSNSLVDMYVKCGFLNFAREAFDRQLRRDAISWNSLISGHLALGRAEEVLELFEQMQFEKVAPSIITYVCILNACACLKALPRGEKIHAELQVRDLDRDLLVGNALIDMYAKCGMLAKAREVFKKLLARSEVSWTTLIGGYVENGFGNEALMFFREMMQEGVRPDVATFACTLKACGILGSRTKGEEMHAEILKSDRLERDLAVSSSLIDMYVKCGLLTKARELHGMMPLHNVCLWTMLVAGYVEEGLGEEALNCFEQMSLEHGAPDDVAYICGLRACGSVGAAKRGRELHAEAARRELVEKEPAVGSALVEMYARCGSLNYAQQVFDRLSVQDVASWNFLIAGHSRIGDCDTVFEFLWEMLQAGSVPDSVTLMNVLRACKHVGLSHKNMTHLGVMDKDFGLKLTPDHQACMIDILCRTGYVGEALAMIRKVPYCLDWAVWHSLLETCRVLGNAELGKEAFQYALQADRENVPAYISIF